MEKERGKKPMSNSTFRKVWYSVLAVVLILTIGINFGLHNISAIMNQYFGKGKAVVVDAEGTADWDTNYYTSNFSTIEEAAANGGKVAEQLCEEGFVLLKNKDQALPLVEGNRSVSLIGAYSVEPVYGGSGSGGASSSAQVTPYDGLVNAGLEVDQETYQFFQSAAPNYPKGGIAMDSYDDSTFFIGEIPSSAYTFSPKSTDAALVFLGRPGGEGWDLSTDLQRDSKNKASTEAASANPNVAAEISHYQPGQHHLELCQEEKDMIAYAKANYDKVIIIVNSAAALELGDLEKDAGIDAILWVGMPGQTGFNALGRILTGEVNPSGHLVDTYVSDLTKDPTFVNFGGTQYTDIGEGDVDKSFQMTLDGGEYATYFVDYEEGIYVGYKYYETAAAEAIAGNYPGFSYDSAVVYPFGYGLSYTDFEQQFAETPELNDGAYTFKINVTNTGDVPGKQVVQLYMEAPYTPNGVEKSKVTLIGFAKTKLLAPSESQTVDITVKLDEMASYDYKTEQAYVLEQGNYTFYLSEHSHSWADESTPSWTTNLDRIVFGAENPRSSDKVAATNLFDDISAMMKDENLPGYARNMSRADFAGRFPTAPTAAETSANTVLINEKTIRDYLKPYENINDGQEKAPVMGEDNGLSLISMRGIDYNDGLWDLFLNQLTEDDYAHADEYINNNAFNTPAMDRLGKPGTQETDGPAGLGTMLASIATNYCVETVIASTWSVDLAYAMGDAVANEALFNGISGWYAPGVNIHRSAFSGRNFEYYSEDSLLSGKLCASVSSGAANMGCYTVMKHFALNDQEAYRKNNICTWANEQAIREIYLKPFEIAVKEASYEMKYIADESGAVTAKKMPACTALMSSFNRIGAVWAGGSTALMTDVLREEWGFAGFALTDFNCFEYMVPDQGMRAGSDLDLTFRSEVFSMQVAFEDVSSATARNAIRTAIKNMCYTVANSNAMNHVAPGATVHYELSPWQIALIVGDCLVALFMISALAWVFIRTKKHADN